MNEQEKLQCLGQRLLSKGFGDWFRALFKIIEGRPFIVEPIHPELFQVFEDVYLQKRKRVNINLPPRSAKTTLGVYFLVYGITKNPKCNFIYTSYSQTLLNTIATQVRDILENPLYKEMYPQRIITEDEEIKPADEFWAEYLLKTTGKNTYSSKKIITYAGGTCLFASVGAQVTGMGCFSYDTLILTEDGFKQIGDVVENKYSGKVWSYNFETKQKELQSICNYIKNEKSEYLKLVLDNKEEIYCTPDHIFYLKSGQEIRADKLRIGFKIMSNSLNLGNGNIKFFSNIFAGIIFIYSKIQLLLCKVFKVIIKFCSLFISLITNILGNFIPSTTTFNITNRAIRQTVIFCYLFIWAFIFSNSYSNFFIDFVKFVIGIVFIFHIFFCRSISQIFKSVIGGIRVKMSNLLVRFTNKSQQDKSMNEQSPIFTIFLKINSFISFIVGGLFHKTIAFCGKNITCFRNIISLISGYREIVDIVDCKHTASSYCVTLWNNNNFYITKSQVLVHNCGQRSSKSFSGALILDDANKPADIRSELMREKVLRYFEETLLSRLNNPDVPILNIQQRLHLEDLSGLLLEKYGYETIKRPLLDENGVCLIPTQYSEERIKELQINNYMFSAQYQQEPIVLGGSVIKREWFRYYDINTKYKYKKIVIAGDTAMMAKEHSDYTCLLVGGITEQNKLHILEMVHQKLEYPELKQATINLYNSWQRGKNETNASALYLENKASGIQLIQDLRKSGLPVIPIEVTKDKLARVEEVLEYIASGNVLLPVSEYYGDNPTIIKECEAFTRDLTQTHDDIVDTLVYLINNSIANRKLSILEVL